MNCEKCKNRKATVFFADEGGGKHALCAACNTSRLKVISPEASADAFDTSDRFLPSTLLLSLSYSHALTPILRNGDNACKGCGATEELVSSLGHMLCPDCYGSFLNNVSSSPKKNDTSAFKMPYSIREKANKDKLLSDLRAQMKLAIEAESFEKAAAIRDKIRAIESK